MTATLRTATGAGVTARRCELAARAAALEAEGDLEAATATWLEAAFATRPGAVRDAFVARAQAIERRGILIAELVAARTEDPRGFAELGIAAADVGGIELGGERFSWTRVPVDVLTRAAGRTQLSRDAQLALIEARMLGGDASGEGGALAALAAMLERGDADEYQAWELVARHLGVDVPEDGFVFQSGRWLDRTELENLALLARITELEGQLTAATPERRAEAFWSPNPRFQLTR